MNPETMPWGLIVAFRVFFSAEGRAWVAAIEEKSLSWIAPSPGEALNGLMALTPVPNGIVDGAVTPEGRQGYDAFIKGLIDSGAARGCECDKPACHCDGIADVLYTENNKCACCLADCPSVHHQADLASTCLPTRHAA